MAKAATKEDIRALDEDLVPAGEFLSLDAPPGPRTKPIVEAIVVYLGGHPHYSCAMQGRIFSESVEEEDGTSTLRETAGAAGFTKYIFEVHDRLGRLNRARTIGDRAPIQARGRPYDTVKHPDHIMKFDEGINYGDGRVERFLVLFTGADRERSKRLMDEYAARVRRYRQREQDELEENVTGPGVRASM